MDRSGKGQCLDKPSVISGGKHAFLRRESGLAMLVSCADDTAYHPMLTIVGSGN